MNPIQAMRDLFAAFTSTIEDVSEGPAMPARRRKVKP